MPRDKEHLILQQWQEPLPKRKSGVEKIFKEKIKPNMEETPFSNQKI